MSKRPSCFRDPCGLYIGMWSMNSFLDSEMLREGRKERGRPKTGFPVQSSGLNLTLRDDSRARFTQIITFPANYSVVNVSTITQLTRSGHLVAVKIDRQYPLHT